MNGSDCSQIQFYPKEQKRLINIARRVIVMESRCYPIVIKEIDHRFLSAVDMIFDCKGWVIVSPD